MADELTITRICKSTSIINRPNNAVANYGDTGALATVDNWGKEPDGKEDATVLTARASLVESDVAVLVSPPDAARMVKLSTVLPS